MEKQIGLYDLADRMEKITKLGDRLVRLNEEIDWEMFRPILVAAFAKERKGHAGRPPYDVVMMLKILVLQRLRNLSDYETECEINDRMSFMRFLGLGLGDRVPNEKTIWLFKDKISKTGIMEELFSLFGEVLKESGQITQERVIVDSTFVDAPKQHNTREENQTIKSGEIPEEWKKPENAHKLAQKDTDARWAKKNDEQHFGYKNNVKVDAGSKYIINYVVTDASVHDSQTLPELIDEQDKVLYADSAYTGKDLLAALPESVEIRVHEKGYRNHPLTNEQKENNREKSRIRVRVEHIFGFIAGAMKGITLRSIGMTRAKFNIALTNLVYNLFRYVYLKRKAV